MKWCNVHKSGWMLALVLVCGLAESVRAQGAETSTTSMTRTQTIERFKVPEFDVNGVKKSEIFGERAVIPPDGKVKITGLKIFLFSQGEIETTISAAECTFDRAQKLAFSNGGVTIERGKMRVTGKGFRWASENQHIEILNSVRVVLQGMPVWQKKEKQ